MTLQPMPAPQRFAGTSAHSSSDPISAPFYDDIAEGPAGGAAHWLITTDGLRVRAAHWGAEAPKGTVLLFPGRTEYAEKYGRTAADLLQRGYATLTIDWRGQGLADRMTGNAALGHVGQFRDYQRDVAALLDHAQFLDLPRPYFMLAHSMGGCIGLRSVIDGSPVRAVAFTAPMWGIELTGSLRPVAWAISGLGRSLGFAERISPGQKTETYISRAPFEGNTLTSDADMFAYMHRQLAAHPELCLGGPSLQWLNEALREMRKLAQTPSPALPTITFLGTGETIVDSLRINQRMPAWPGGTLVTIPDARHEILMEKPEIRTMCLDRMTALFDANR